MASQSSKGKGRKIGRNKVKCAAYRAKKGPAIGNKRPHHKGSNPKPTVAQQIVNAAERQFKREYGEGAVWITHERGGLIEQHTHVPNSRVRVVA